jgi:hypothetical protein
VPTVFTYPQEVLPLDLKRQALTIITSEWPSVSSGEEQVHPRSMTRSGIL